VTNSLIDTVLPKGCSDQGREFDCLLLREICDYWGISKTRSSPFYPQSNGLVERSNRSIKQILRQASEEDAWDKKLPKIRMTLNCTEHSGTSVTPFRVFYSRSEEATLPLDMLIGNIPDRPVLLCQQDWVWGQKRACQEVAEVVRVNTQKQIRMRVAGAERAGLKIRKYRVGEMVWRLCEPNKRDKFNPYIWKGPYKVEVVEPDNYVVGIRVPTPGRGQGGAADPGPCFWCPGVVVVAFLLFQIANREAATQAVDSRLQAQARFVALVTSDRST
jgi:hypothetical protein